MFIIEIDNFCNFFFDFKMMSVCVILWGHISLLNPVDHFFIDIALKVIMN